MKSLLQNVSDLDYFIRQLHKMASFIRSGENVDAWRECHSLIAVVNKAKQDLIASVDQEVKENDK